MAAPKNAGGVLQGGNDSWNLCAYLQTLHLPLFRDGSWSGSGDYWRVGRKGMMKPLENLTKQEHSGPLQSLSFQSLALFSLTQSESHINPSQSLHDEKSE